MAEDVNKLAVLIEANTRSYENAMKKIIASTNSASTRSQASIKKMDGALRGLQQTSINMAPVLGRVGAALAAGFSLRGAIRFADAAKRVDNSLKVAGLSGRELVEVQDQLFQSAIRNSAPIEALAELYGKASLVQKELGVSSSELIKFTDGIAVALRVSGKTAAESSGALMQLSQALGAGTVRAEEFNSILEGAPTIALAVAAGLEEAGGSVAKLKSLVIDGQISSEAFFRAFEAGKPILDDMAKNVTPTFSNAMENLNTALIASVGNFDKATGASSALGQSINDLAGIISGIDWDGMFSQADQTIARVFAARDRFYKQAGNILKDTFGGGTVPSDYNFSESVARPPNAGYSPDGFTFGATNRGGTKVNPVSISDFSAPGSKKSGSGSAARSAALREETERIEQLRGAYSSASEIIDQFAERQDEATRKQRELADEFSSFADGLISDLSNGASAADALNNALNRVLDSFISTGIDGFSQALASAFMGAGSSASTSMFTAAGGPRFGGPRALGGPVGPNRPYLVGERGPELFVPSTAGTVRGNAGGSSTVVNIVNNSGAPVQETRRQSGNREIVDVVIGEVNKAVAGGKMDKSMSSRYGATPKRMQG